METVNIENQQAEEPRILLVNLQSVNKANATGITMRSLFRAWPVNRALEIRLEAGEAPVNTDDLLRIESMAPAHNAARRFAGGVLLKRINTRIKARGIADAQVAGKQTALSKLRQACVLLIDACPATLSRKQWGAVDAFDPQAIYTLGASVSALRLAHRISVRRNVPIVIHFLDHWAGHLQWEGNSLVRPYRKRLDRWLARCMERTRHILTVSEPMAEAYEQRFQKPCNVLMNAVDLAAFRLAPKQPDGAIRLIYAGGLHLNRWRALLDIGRALGQMQAGVRLDIYTDEASQRWNGAFVGLPVAFHPAVSHETIAEVYSGADILVHCESDDPLLKGFYQYSISTKIPEYLATGRPILYYGPEDTGVYGYLSKQNAAFIASQPDALPQTIRAMLDKRQCESIVTAAQALARQNHDSNEAQAALKRAFLRVRMEHDEQTEAR